jgi:hypothetical protein
VMAIAIAPVAETGMAVQLNSSSPALRGVVVAVAASMLRAVGCCIRGLAVGCSIWAERRVLRPASADALATSRQPVQPAQQQWRRWAPSLAVQRQPAQ